MIGALSSASRTRIITLLRRTTYRPFTASSNDTIQRETDDEKELRLAFDDKEWGQYSATSGASQKPVGYFGQDYLREPSGLALKAQDTLRRCQALVQDIETSEPTALVIKKLDILSDMICMVVDTAEFIRNTDPDEKWVDGANEVYNVLGNFLGQLNTHSGLHSALKRVLDSKTVANSLSKEERIVAELFLSDFEKYGVHLDHSRRSKLIELNDRMNALSHSFSRTEAAISPPQQVHMLEDLLESRKKLASLLGHESYAHFYLQDKMAKTPERVIRFLNTQNESNRNAAEKELAILSSIRQRQSIIHEVTQNDRNIMFHRAKVDNCFPYPLKEYFTVGSVISGASRLFKQLYGVRFEPEPVADGEVWHKSVRKLSVIDEEAGKIGTIYMDLYKRSRNELPKLSSAAQFTIRCSRRYDDDPTNILPASHYEALNFLGLPKLSSAAQFTIRCSRRYDDDPINILPASHYEALNFLGVNKPNGEDHKFQLPVVVLSCNFTPPRQEHPTFLNFAIVEVLLHELGHAMHSMFARTQYQHVAGTRGKLDFVEVPSIFMEFLIKSPSVASAVSRHYQTGQKLPPNAFSKWIEAYQSFAALDQQLQLFYAWLDIQYHSWKEQKRIKTSDILLKAYKDFNVFPFGGDKYQQAQFGHLGGYGSVYYSYLWSREIAKHVYEGQFEPFLSNPNIEDTKLMDRMRESGELFKNEVLAHGASKNPWDMNWHKFVGKRLSL
ncbi:hypothetical protein MP638_004254 [Amoeboaphelidium occidentale]|nr:hypothetical protein MP638_004254 [Amoeboaphelidium occidentale]